jgi:transcriptional regulator with XRE-family HTH domain
MAYDFGVLRELRKNRNLTINALSKMCGVSYVALSKLERNQGNPELRTLERIAKALGVSAHHLLALAQNQQPVRVSHQACKVFGKADCRYVDLDGTRVLIIHAPKGANGVEAEFHRDDYERCVVLNGRVKVTVSGSEFLLGAGDGLAWDAMFDHQYSMMEPSTFVTMLTPKHA